MIRFRVGCVRVANTPFYVTKVQLKNDTLNSVTSIKAKTHLAFTAGLGRL